MTEYVVLLRAVNVAPRWVKMARLREVLQDSDFEVETYIQSGNLLIGTRKRSVAAVRSSLERVIEQEFGFEVPCIVRTPAQLRETLEWVDGLTSPLPDVTRQYVTFFADPIPHERVLELDEWDVDGERLHARAGEVAWWLAKSTHEAKLSNARLERGGHIATTRDLKVVRTLVDRWAS